MRSNKKNQLCKKYVYSEMFVDRYSIASQPKKEHALNHSEICEDFACAQEEQS